MRENYPNQVMNTEGSMRIYQHKMGYITTNFIKMSAPNNISMPRISACCLKEWNSGEWNIEVWNSRQWEWNSGEVGQ